MVLLFVKLYHKFFKKVLAKEVICDILITKLGQTNSSKTLLAHDIPGMSIVTSPINPLKC